jgi:hypothetical protein
MTMNRFAPAAKYGRNPAKARKTVDVRLRRALLRAFRAAIQRNEIPLRGAMGGI